MSIVLFVFTLIAKGIYFIFRFAISFSYTRESATVIRWCATAMTVAGIRGTGGVKSNQIAFSVDIAIDSFNTLYVSDWMNHRIQR